MFASIKSAKLPEAGTTEHSDVDRFVHLVVQCPKVGPFNRALSQNRCATRASRNVLTIFETFSKMISLEWLTPRAESLPSQ